MQNNKLIKVYQTLLKHFGPQHWWPGDTPFEVMIGAILTQNTNWGNVERAIANLKQSKVLSPKSLVQVNKSKLERLIRPSGYFRVKAKKLKVFCKWMIREYQGKAGNIRGNQGELRKELLGIWGIGPETADSILCYALDNTNFVVDAYTVRIFNRLGLIKNKDYHEIKEFFETNLPKSLKLYKEYHALIVALGKDICRPKPICKKCPVATFCSY
ncbi:endonuclease III domain-containing protein [Candidatus Margulisiibacteriota bacterium]